MGSWEWGVGNDKLQRTPSLPHAFTVNQSDQVG